MEAVFAELLYYVRERYWRTAQTFSLQEQRRGQDQALAFWSAFVVFREGAVNEAIRQLEAMAMRRDIQFACYVALNYMHQKCRLIDHERVSLMKIKITEQRGAAPDSALLLAAQFLNFVEKQDKAKVYLGEVLQRNPANMQAKIGRAWSIVLKPEEDTLVTAKQNQALLSFNEVLAEAGDFSYTKCLDAWMGLAKLYELGRKYEKVRPR
jgi:hypothetical protein